MGMGRLNSPKFPDNSLHDVYSFCGETFIVSLTTDFHTFVIKTVQGKAILIIYDVLFI